MTYLRRLQDMTGRSFAWPETRKAASEEIAKLKKYAPTEMDDRRREIAQVRRDMATRRGDGARVRARETGGYGSGAHWADDSAEEDRDRGAGR